MGTWVALAIKNRVLTTLLYHLLVNINKFGFFFALRSGHPRLKGKGILSLPLVNPASSPKWLYKFCTQLQYVRVPVVKEDTASKRKNKMEARYVDVETST